MAQRKCKRWWWPWAIHCWHNVTTGLDKWRTIPTHNGLSSDRVVDVKCCKCGAESVKWWAAFPSGGAYE